MLDLPDAALMDIVAIVMGESLAAGSAAVEAVGLVLGVDMAQWWDSDDAFLGLLRDRELLGSLLAEGAGEAVAAATSKDKAKTPPLTVGAHLDGETARNAPAGEVQRRGAVPPSPPTQP